MRVMDTIKLNYRKELETVEKILVTLDFKLFISIYKLQTLTLFIL